MSEWEVRRFATLDSTNTYLLAEARAGARSGVVVVADHQSAGRGRLDRRWESPPGTGLLMSVLLRPVLAPAQLHLCAVAGALALSDACAAVAGVRPLVKWPNDLVVADAKLAGVLAEADPSAPGGPPGSVAVVVGMGCNLTWPGPPGVGGTSLADCCGRAVGRDDLLDATLVALGPRVAQLGEPGGRRSLVGALRRRSATLGRTVRIVRGGTADLVGVAVSITPDGHLVVRDGDGADGRDLEVAAGDVELVRHAGD